MKTFTVKELAELLAKLPSNLPTGIIAVHHNEKEVYLVPQKYATTVALAMGGI